MQEKNLLIIILSIRNIVSYVYCILSFIYERVVKLLAEETDTYQEDQKEHPEYDFGDK